MEAYDLFKAIYQERGYRAKDIPRLILEKNLFGLEIDDRAAQLAAFALMMKARADDRRIFERGVQPHVLSIQESKGMDAQAITEALNEPILKEKQPPSGELFEEIAEEKSPLFSRKNLSKAGDISQADVAHLIDLFEHGKTFGSLIQIPEKLAEKLPAIAQRVDDVIAHGGMFEQGTAREFNGLVEQARLLAQTFGVVAANPPFLGGKGMNPALKDFSANTFPLSQSDAYSMFVERSKVLCKQTGIASLVTPFVWMFISSFSRFRESLHQSSTITSLIQLEYNGFEPACVPVCVFSFLNLSLPTYLGDFIRLSAFKGHENQAPRTREAIQNPSCGWRYRGSTKAFTELPGSPIAYWASPKVRHAFTEHSPLKDISTTKKGMATGDNERFVRIWTEVDFSKVGLNLDREDASNSRKKWFPYANGGSFRKWYGHHLDVVNWENDGHQLRTERHETGRIRATNLNLDVIFSPGLTWSAISSSYFGVRVLPKGFLFSSVSSALFAPNHILNAIAAFLNSKVTPSLVNILNPTMHFNPGDVSRLPVFHESSIMAEASAISNECVNLSKKDLDSAETSWDFLQTPLLEPDSTLIAKSFSRWCQECEDALIRLKELEEENNRRFIDAYGVEDEITANVEYEELTLYRPDREEDIKRLTSYAIGCMMGRYSLDEPGLVYAHSGNEGFDPAKYKTFPADEDGIVPLTELEWFEDDAALRFVKFIATAWPKEHLEENLKFVAESLGQKRGESPRETIRRYLAADFYKHHLSMYKKRPIYWLFSSGKQRGFQALVYLHRYNEGTLARMRTQYVIPLIGKMTARIDHLTEDIATENSSSQQRKRLEKEKSLVTKQLAEVQAFEEQLRHHADQRISLDLDDGVKVNYGKFGDLLADVTKITGKKAGD